MRWRTQLLIALVLLLSLGAGGASSATGPDAAQLAAQIDGEIDARLKAEHVPAAEPADDAEFLRRVYLDLHGEVPTAEQATRFLSDPRLDRRARLVDALLDDPRYGEYLGDLAVLHTPALPKGAGVQVREARGVEAREHFRLAHVRSSDK